MYMVVKHAFLHAYLYVSSLYSSVTMYLQLKLGAILKLISIVDIDSISRYTGILVH